MNILHRQIFGGVAGRASLGLKTTRFRKAQRVLVAVILASTLFAVANTARAEGHLYRLYVEGLACPMCGYSLEVRLKKLFGVMDVQTDYRDGVVTITMLPGLSLEQGEAMQTVRDAGFIPRHLEHAIGDGLISPTQIPLSN